MDSSCPKVKIKLVSPNCIIRGSIHPVQEWLNLKNFFQCTLICHECRVDKSTYMRRALHADRYSLQEFRDECLKPGPTCSWIELNSSNFIRSNFWVMLIKNIVLVGASCLPGDSFGRLFLTKPGDSSFTLKVPCYYSRISEWVWWSGALCIWSIWAVTCGLWEIAWKPFSWTLLFGEILKMDVRMMTAS